MAPVSNNKKNGNGDGYTVKGWALWTGIGAFLSVIAVIITSVFWLSGNTRPQSEVEQIAKNIFITEFDARVTWEDERTEVLPRIAANESIVNSNQMRLDRVEDNISNRLDRLESRINELLLSIRSTPIPRAP